MQSHSQNVMVLMHTTQFILTKSGNVSFIRENKFRATSNNSFYQKKSIHYVLWPFEARYIILSNAFYTCINSDEANWPRACSDCSTILKRNTISSNQELLLFDNMSSDSE